LPRYFPLLDAFDQKGLLIDLNLSPVAGFGLIRGGCGITRDIRDAASHSGIMLGMGGAESRQTFAAKIAALRTHIRFE
jgi:hypothetical protein